MRFDERTPHTPLLLLLYSLRFYSIASSFHWLPMGMIYWLAARHSSVSTSFQFFHITNESINFPVEKSIARRKKKYEISFFRLFFSLCENESKAHCSYARTNGWCNSIAEWTLNRPIMIIAIVCGLWIVMNARFLVHNECDRRESVWDMHLLTHHEDCTVFFRLLFYHSNAS